jgi:hypothetical protein
MESRRVRLAQVALKAVGEGNCGRPVEGEVNLRAATPTRYLGSWPSRSVRTRGGTGTLFRNRSLRQTLDNVNDMR